MKMLFCKMMMGFIKVHYIKKPFYRLLFGLVFAGLVWATPLFKDENGVYPAHFYVIIIIVYLIHQVRGSKIM